MCNGHVATAHTIQYFDISPRLEVRTRDVVDHRTAPKLAHARSPQSGPQSMAIMLFRWARKFIAAGWLMSRGTPMRSRK